MIEKIKKRFTGRQQKSRKTSDHDWLQPHTLSEDIFPRKGIPRESSITSADNGSSPPSLNSFHRVTDIFFADDGCGQPQGKDRRLIRGLAFVPDGFGPGQKVKLRYSDGNKVEADIPPRSEWQFMNCNGEPRPFFLIRVDQNGRSVVLRSSHPPMKFSLHTSSPKREQNRSAKSRKKVHFIESSQMDCQCAPSLGVHDSICPYHGMISHHS